MNIIFYNTFAVGDLYFNKPFLKHLCENNPSVQFQIHTNYGSFFYKDIPNLHLVDKEDYPLHHPHRYRLFKFFEAYSKELIVKYDPQTLFVNTWVGVLNRLIEPLSAECHPINLYSAFQRLVEEVNKLLPEKLLFPPMEKEDFIYKMPSLNIESFLEFQRQAKKETIFYFNRMGMSASSKPFDKEDDHRMILEALSISYPDKYIIVPNAAIQPNRPNIVPTRVFGSIENQTCENVLMDMEIAGHCTYAVLFDVGAAYTYCNTTFDNYTAKFYHLSKDPQFCFLAKQGLESCLNKDTSRVVYVPCSTPEEVISVIQQRI